MPALPSAAAFEPLAPDATGMPLYRAVKRSLLRAIESGAYRPGQALPSEAALAGAFAVSIGTLRKAVDELAAEHILARRQGRGTFVARMSGERSLQGFFRLEAADGVRALPVSELLSFERVRASAEAASALGLSPGDALLQFEQRLSVDGTPVALECMSLPAAAFKGLSEKLLREPATAQAGGLYRLYQAQFGHTVVRARERARAGAADRRAARALGLAPGAPVLLVRRTAVALGERPIEFRRAVIDTAHHDYVSVLSGSPAQEPPR